MLSRSLTDLFGENFADGVLVPGTLRELQFAVRTLRDLNARIDQDVRISREKLTTVGVLDSRSAVIDVDAYLSLLTVDGALVNVGAPAEPLSLNIFSLIGGRRAYAGSMIGGIAETQEMLDFCAEHGIVPETELISADRVNDAYERVLASDVRYRFVIDAATLA